MRTVPQLATGHLIGGGGIGQAVHVNGKFAFACVAQGAQPPQLLLASFDPTLGTFRLSTYAQERVIGLGGGDDLTFQPDLTLATEFAAPGAAPGAECYYNGLGLYVAVFNAANQWQMLNMQTGEIILWPQGEQVHVFRRWRVGVRNQQSVLWLLAVGTTLETWAST